MWHLLLSCISHLLPCWVEGGWQCGLTFQEYVICIIKYFLLTLDICFRAEHQGSIRTVGPFSCVHFVLLGSFCTCSALASVLEAGNKIRVLPLGQTSFLFFLFVCCLFDSPIHNQLYTSPIPVA